MRITKLGSSCLTKRKACEPQPKAHFHEKAIALGGRGRVDLCSWDHPCFLVSASAGFFQFKSLCDLRALSWVCTQMWNSSPCFNFHQNQTNHPWEAFVCVC